MAQPDIFQILTQLKPERQEPFNHNLVDGMMVPAFITQQRLDELKTFKLRPDDVFVVTYPKSGIYGDDDQFEPIAKVTEGISGQYLIPDTPLHGPRIRSS